MSQYFNGLNSCMYIRDRIFKKHCILHQMTNTDTWQALEDTFIWKATCFEIQLESQLYNIYIHVYNTVCLSNQNTLKKNNEKFSGSNYYLLIR